MIKVPNNRVANLTVFFGKFSSKTFFFTYINEKTKLLPNELKKGPTSTFISSTRLFGTFENENEWQKTEPVPI